MDISNAITSMYSYIVFSIFCKPREYICPWILPLLSFDPLCVGTLLFISVINSTWCAYSTFDGYMGTGFTYSNAKVPCLTRRCTLSILCNTCSFLHRSFSEFTITLFKAPNSSVNIALRNFQILNGIQTFEIKYNTALVRFGNKLKQQDSTLKPYYSNRNPFTAKHW